MISQKVQTTPGLRVKMAYVLPWCAVKTLNKLGKESGGSEAQNDGFFRPPAPLPYQKRNKCTMKALFREEKTVPVMDNLSFSLEILTPQAGKGLKSPNVVDLGLDLQTAVPAVLAKIGL